MLPGLTEVLSLKKRVVYSPRLMNPLEPLNTLFNQPIVAGDTMSRNMTLTETQSIRFRRRWISLHPTPESFLKVILIEHSVSPLPHDFLSLGRICLLLRSFYIMLLRRGL